MDSKNHAPERKSLSEIRILEKEDLNPLLAGAGKAIDQFNKGQEYIKTEYGLGIETMSYFTNIFYYIPIILIICLVLSWTCFNLLGQLAHLYKKHKTHVYEI